MTDEAALDISSAIAAGKCSLTIHRGSTAKDRAIRVTGAFKADAERIGREIAANLPGKFVSDGGFVAVWF